MNDESVREYIERTAQQEWSDYQLARTDQDRQDAIDRAHRTESLAIEKFGNEYADSLPWNVARQQESAPQRHHRGR